MPIHIPYAVYSSVDGFIDNGGALANGTPYQVLGADGSNFAAGLKQPEHLRALANGTPVNFGQLSDGNGYSVTTGTFASITRAALYTDFEVDNTSGACEITLDFLGSSLLLREAHLYLLPDPAGTDSLTNDCRIVVRVEASGTEYYGVDVTHNAGTWTKNNIAREGGAESVTANRTVTGGDGKPRHIGASSQNRLSGGLNTYSWEESAFDAITDGELGESAVVVFDPATDTHTVRIEMDPGTTGANDNLTVRIYAVGAVPYYNTTDPSS